MRIAPERLVLIRFLLQYLQGTLHHSTLPRCVASDIHSYLDNLQ